MLLLAMCGVGFASATWGFNLGRDALKGVTQPEFNPTQDRRARASDDPNRDPTQVKLLDEVTILQQVAAKTSGQSPPAQATTASAPAQPSPSPAVTPDDPAEGTRLTSGQLPKSTVSENVTLTVVGMREQEGSLILEVEMQNKGDRPVQFLYTFLDATDDQGRPLSAIAQGLPGEISAQSDPVRGEISIPTVLLDDVRSINLTLTDYPDQQLQLQLTDLTIPL